YSAVTQTSRSLRHVSIFFFSSRRRHTRCLSDWSSDVCSSDLCILLHVRPALRARNRHHILPLCQQPGQGQLPRRDILLVGQATHLGHEVQIATEILSLKAWIAASEIVQAGNCSAHSIR